MDIINQIIAQEQSVYIVLAEFAVFTVLISLILYHLTIYLGRKSFPEGKLYLYFSGLFFGLLFYIFLDTMQFGILLGGLINVPAWNAFLIAVSWLIILKSLMLILEFSLRISQNKTAVLSKVFKGFAVVSVLSMYPIFGAAEKYVYATFLIVWFSLGIVIVVLLISYMPVLTKRKQIELSSRIIGWTSLSYISYIWFYKLITSSSVIEHHLPFWVVNNFLKIGVAFTFAYALAIRFNKEFCDLIELKENLEKKVEEGTGELQKAKKKIEDASALKTKYFINVAHETKTPLTLIGNYLDRYSKRVGPSEELRIVKENIDLLREAMVLYLDVEKFEKGAVIYNSEAVCNLSNALKLKAALFQEEARQKARNLIVEISDGIKVLADPLAIERIIHNLFDNALKYTNEQDEITVWLNTDSRSAILAVRDSGIGIPAVDLPRIFDLYFQASDSDNRNSGFGMGLYIVKQTVEALHGTIGVQSEMGKGTTFTIKLPLAGDSTSGEKPQETVLPAPAKKTLIRSVENDFQAGQKSLLVVEDNPDMMRYLKDELNEQYNVFAAKDGNEALFLLKTSPRPDLILSDVMMAGMDGFELYRRVNKDAALGLVPFIFITARSNNDEKLEMLRQGVSDYIFKPFSMDELKAKVVSVLKNSNVQRQAGLQDAINAIHSQFEPSSKPESTKWDLFAARSREFELTERQIEVIKLVDQGLEYKQIAEVMNISQKTVHRHIQILFEKFQVHNKLELLKIFFE
jgi:signal transduction histidine kinase/DNA-binding NarL/FixJ family response regulator